MKKKVPSGLKNCKKRGEWVELCFAARAFGIGLHLGTPWGESAGYDFTVEQESGRVVRVQVKSTMFEQGSGYSCTLKNSRGPYRNNTFDFVVAYVIPEDAWYVIPAEKVRRRWSVALYPGVEKSKYGAYQEAWHLLRGSDRPDPGTVDRIEACAEEESCMRAELSSLLGHMLAYFYR